MKLIKILLLTTLLFLAVEAIAKPRAKAKTVTITLVRWPYT